jgi:hypothetical protein
VRWFVWRNSFSQQIAFVSVNKKPCDVLCSKPVALFGFCVRALILVVEWWKIAACRCSRIPALIRFSLDTNWFSLTPAQTERFVERVRDVSPPRHALACHPVVFGGVRGWHVVSVAVILTYLLLGPADHAKWVVPVPTHSRTHTDWGLSWSFKLHQMHGIYRTFVRGGSPSCSPQELINGVRGNVAWKSSVEFNFVSYRLCITRTERETPVDICRFFKYFFFFFLRKYRYVLRNGDVINFCLPKSYVMQVALRRIYYE